MELKRFRVQMWAEFTDTAPSEDEWVNAHTHMQALEIVCHRLCVYYMAWVRVEGPDGQVMRFLDVSGTLGGSVEYDVFSS